MKQPEASLSEKAYTNTDEGEFWSSSEERTNRGKVSNVFVSNLNYFFF
jgi:hypothetical protein